MINLSDYKNIHCIGIGGIGLSAIAEILAARGYRVSGSDMKQSEITDSLTEKGIEVQAASKKTIAEEAPETYKDIEEVIHACDTVGVSKRVARLVPIGVIKG